MTTAQNREAAREIIATNVRGKAGERRLSIRALSEAVGIDYSAMLRRTRGEVDFTATELVATATALGIDVRDLMPEPHVQAVAS